MASAFTYMTQLWILPLLAVSSIMHALYAVSVRRPAILPPASFRPCLATTPLLLASDLELLVPSCTRSGLSPPNQCPCRANRTKAGPEACLATAERHVSDKSFIAEQLCCRIIIDEEMPIRMRLKKRCRNHVRHRLCYRGIDGLGLNGMRSYGYYRLACHDLPWEH